MLNKNKMHPTDVYSNTLSFVLLSFSSMIFTLKFRQELYERIYLSEQSELA